MKALVYWASIALTAVAFCAYIIIVVFLLFALA